MLSSRYFDFSPILKRQITRNHKINNKASCDMSRDNFDTNAVAILYKINTQEELLPY